MRLSAQHSRRTNRVIDLFYPAAHDQAQASGRLFSAGMCCRFCLLNNPVK
jgi:hypothetical protein